MAIATYSEFASRMSQLVPVHFYKATGAAGSVVTRLSTRWQVANDAGAVPSTATSLSRTSTGALNQNVPFLNSSVLARSSINISGGVINTLLIDRLSHQGGLSAIVTTEQTTNLPTAALTRYTSGVGVMIGLEIYVNIGNTNATATVRYTNQDGTGSRTSKSVQFTSSGTSANRFIIVPLADGDTGVRSVEGVTLSASSGTAGNFGVTLFKPLAYINPAVAGVEAYGTNNFNALLGSCCQFEAIDPNACLALLDTPSGNSSGTLTGTLNFMDIT